MCTTQAGQGNTLGMGLQLGGGIASAFGARSYANSQANYLSTMANITGTMADKAIDSTEYVGGMQASAVRAKGQQMIGTQKAALAANNISGGFTYQNILDDTTAKSEKDALAIQYNTDAQAQNIRNQASLQIAGLNAQASATKAQGQVSFVNGLLSTGSQFANNYFGWQGTSKGSAQGATAASYNTSNSLEKSVLGDTNFYTGNKTIDSASLGQYNNLLAGIPSWKQATYTQGVKLW